MAHGKEKLENENWFVLYVGILRILSVFKSVNYTFSETNKGLGNSVIKGVTEVINRYGKAIVLEDDLILAPNFLFFMNQGLDKYKEEKSVFSICGYSNKVKVPKDYSYDTYFCTRSSSWGWATWADRWNSVDWELENFDKYHILKKEFNRWGGSDCWKMLNDWKCGRNKSWAIRFCFAQFLQKKFLYFLLQVKCKMMVLMGKVQIVSAGVVFVVYLITRQKKSLHIRKMCLSIHSYFVLLLVIIPS